jgi:hypothetical protein
MLLRKEWIRMGKILRWKERIALAVPLEGRLAYALEGLIFKLGMFFAEGWEARKNWIFWGAISVKKRLDAS